MKKNKLVLGVILPVFLSGCASQVKPINYLEKHKLLQQKLERNYKQQEPLISPISMYTAMAHAAKYNYDIRVKMAESAYHAHNLDLTNFGMLPKLTASAGYTTRSNDYGVFGPTSSSQPSIAGSKHQFTGGVQASWNILDFGIGYLSSKQAADRYVISLQQRRRVLQTLMQDVRANYWRAYSHQSFQDPIKDLSKRVENAMHNLRTTEQRNLENPLTTLRYKDSLMDNFRDVNLLDQNLVGAKQSLKSLMNVRSHQVFRLKPQRPSGLVYPKNLPTEIKALEERALLLRPELHEQAYKKRINISEVHKARLNILPGVSGDIGYNYDGNKYLLNNNWINYGANLSWNLINLFSGSSNIARAKAALHVEDLKQMALAVAIITQTDMAYADYVQAKKEYTLEKRILKTKHEIYRQMRKLHQAHHATGLELVQARSSALLADMRAQVAYTKFQEALARLLASVGYDPLPGFNLHQSVSKISKALAKAFTALPTKNHIETSVRQSLTVRNMHRHHDLDKKAVKRVTRSLSDNAKK